jgi:hypothetical protein
MADGEMPEIFDAVQQLPPAGSWFAYALARGREIVRAAEFSCWDAWMPLHDELWCSYKAAVPEAVAQAFSLLLLGHQNFRPGVVLAGNFGRDADTIGAIVGAVLGAKFGAKAIPEKWREKSRYPTGTCLGFTKGMDLRETAARLAGLIG